jgi:hypothetical protein
MSSMSPFDRPAYGKPLTEALRRPKKEVAHFQGLYTAWQERMILK